MVEAEIFRALGDPIRIEIVMRLSKGEPHTISSVSSDLEISRQGARKHLQVLADAQLIMLKPRGRDTDVVLQPKTLDKGKVFIAKLEKQWDARLIALRDFVENDD